MLEASFVLTSPSFPPPSFAVTVCLFWRHLRSIGLGLCRRDGNGVHPVRFSAARRPSNSTAVVLIDRGVPCCVASAYDGLVCCRASSQMDPKFLRNQVRGLFSPSPCLYACNSRFVAAARRPPTPPLPPPRPSLWINADEPLSQNRK